MTDSWESADKSVRKDVLEKGIFSKKPTERATCNIVIGNIAVSPLSVSDLKDKFRSEMLDCTREKTIVLGDANVELDRQIERAVQTMMPKEKSLVTISVHPLSDFNDSIGPVAVKFEIQLVKFQSHKPIWDWSPQEKYEIALKYKEAGIRLFKDSRYVDSFHKFAKACKILITLEPIPDLELEASLEQKINDLRLVLYNNMASCHLNRHNYEHTVTLCGNVLEKDANNVKALFRRGVARGSLRDFENAVADLKRVTVLEPRNNAARAEYTKYKEEVQKANQRCEDMIKRMFKS